MTTVPRIQTVMAMDATTCIAAGALMALAATPLAGWTGLPVELLRWAGVALFPVALLFGAMAIMDPVPKPLLWLAVLGNVAWTITSVAVTVLFPVTLFGYGFVLVQAASVAGFAVLEARSLGDARTALT